MPHPIHKPEAQQHDNIPVSMLRPDLKPQSGHRVHRSWLTLTLLLYLLGLALWPPVVLADAPNTRGPQPLNQGGLGTATNGAVDTITDVTRWQGVRELPPPGYAMRDLAAHEAATLQNGAENGPIAWLSRNLNPGNWILDAGMGIFAGIVKTFSGLLQKAHEAVIGNASVLPTGCDNAATNFVFCTPGSLTYDHPGVQAIWGVLRSIATGIITILFVVRIGRMVIEGPRTLATEGKSLLLTFILTTIFVQATYPACKLLVDFFNAISSLLLAKAAIAFPSVEANDLNIGSNLMFLFFWIVILLLTIKCFFRLVRIIVLISVAPLAGAMLMDRSTSGRFKSWLDKLIELFFEQINLVIVFVVAAAIVKPFQDRSLGDTFVMSILSIITLLMALMGPSMIGLAAGAGSLGYLQSMMTVGALRRIGRAVSPGHAGAASTQNGSANRLASIHAAKPGSRSAGDPAQSVAAQRQASASSLAGPRGSFRLSDASDSLSAARATARYEAAQDSHAAQSKLPLDSRREQALMRATMMRERATALRGTGDVGGADALSRKAKLHRRFGRGGDIARPARYTPEQRVMRRQTYQQALAEVSGMHALERDDLSQRIKTDEQRLPTLQRELAITGSTSGNAAILHQEHSDLTHRLVTNKARLTLLTPAEGRQLPNATRQAASALANERLPQELRSMPYAMRHGAAKQSAFVKRIANVGTQRAHDELARARATGARMAATPTEQRPPIAPPRRRSTVGQTRRSEEPRTDRNLSARQDQAPAIDPPTRRQSRAPSSTIARMRQQQIDATRNLPRISRRDEDEQKT